MPKKPVTIGELQFDSRLEAKTYFTEILNKYPLSTELIDHEFDDVMSLLLCHPRADEKLGSGVKSIKINRGLYSSNRCFHILRTDGSIEDFSIGKCINGDHSPFHKFCIASRKAVEVDLRNFKLEYFKENGNNDKVVCSATKEKINFDESHVDHREPLTFSAIVHFFVKANNIDLSSVEYLNEGTYGNQFKEDKIAEKFRIWHRDTAKLRVVKARMNLAKSYLGRIASTKADRTLS